MVRQFGMCKVKDNNTDVAGNSGASPCPMKWNNNATHYVEVTNNRFNPIKGSIESIARMQNLLLDGRQIKSWSFRGGSLKVQAILTPKMNKPGQNLIEQIHTIITYKEELISDFGIPSLSPDEQLDMQYQIEVKP